MVNDTARRTALALACAFACAATHAAEISGRVADASGRSGFAGAGVRIVELGRSVTTDRDGRFRADVPAGAYTLQIRYLGAPPVTRSVEVDEGGAALGDIAIGEDVTVLDNILVVGQRAGQAAAINQQRESDTLKSIVSSDAIGQFPDQNAAEALQRLPGVSVQRDQGEGRFVTIRGLDPALNSTTINGVRVPGPQDDSRQVNLDVIASDLLETVEVGKTITPDMDADTVGGNVEIKTLTAFDRGGRTISGRVEGSHNALRGETSPKLAATYTDLFGADDTVGLAASLSWFRREFGSDGIETAELDEVESPDGEDILAIVEGEQRDYTITRERLSATFNLDIRPDADTEFYFRNLFSRFEDEEVQLTNVFKFGDGEVAALDGSTGLFEDATLEKLTEGRTETQDIWSSVLGGVHYLENWTIDYSAAYSRSEEEEADAYGATWVQEGLTLGYDGGDTGRPRFFAQDPDAFGDATAYALDEVVLEPYRTREDETAFTLNLQREFDSGSAFKFGARSRLRGKQADYDSTIFDDLGGDYTLADFPRADAEYPFGTFFPIAGGDGLLDFIRRHRGDFTVDEEETAIENLGPAYDIDEDVHAAYAMATFDLGDLRLIGGVRLERTEFEASGTRVVQDEETGTVTIAPVNAEKSYTDWLPGLHLRWEPSEAVVVRASATRTIARPNFVHVAPAQLITVEEDDGEFDTSAEIGNPDLDPLRSTNLDASIEFYPGDVAVLSAGVFYKKITDFVVLADVAGSGPFEDFEEVIQPLNGDDATVRGIELGWTQQFASLPSPFDGLLISANYAWIDSEAALPGRDGDYPLPRQSDRVGNLAIGYEKYGLSLRLAGTYRSSYLDEIGALDDPRFDRYADDHFQVDLTAKYRINEHFQVYLNGINLNDEPFYAWLGSPRHNSQFETYDRTWELGLQFNF